MHLVKKMKELSFVTEDQVGVLTRVTEALAKEGVNLMAAYAYGAQGKGYFHMITDNNYKAINALKPLGYETKEKEMITIKLDHQVGALKEIVKKISDAAIDIKEFYGTAGDGKCLIILDTADNEKVAKLI